MIPISKSSRKLPIFLSILGLGAIALIIAEHQSQGSFSARSSVSRMDDQELHEAVLKALPPLLIQEGESCGSNPTENYINCSGVEDVIPDIQGIELSLRGRPVADVHRELGADGFRDKIFVPVLKNYARGSRCDHFHDEALFATCLGIVFNMGYHPPGNNTPSVCRDLTTARPWHPGHALNHLLALANQGTSHVELLDILRGYQHHHYNHIVKVCDDLKIYREGGWAKNQRIAAHNRSFTDWDLATTDWEAFERKYTESFRRFELTNDSTFPPGLSDPLNNPEVAENDTSSVSSMSAPPDGSLAVFSGGDLQTVGEVQSNIDPASTLKVPIAALAIARQGGLSDSLKALIKPALVVSENPPANTLIALAGGIDRVNQVLSQIDPSLKLARNFGEPGPAHTGTTLSLAKMLKEVLDPQSNLFELSQSDRAWLVSIMSKTPQELGYDRPDGWCRFSSNSDHAIQKCGASAGQPQEFSLLFASTDGAIVGAISIKGGNVEEASQAIAGATEGL